MGRLRPEVLPPEGTEFEEADRFMRGEADEFADCDFFGDNVQEAGGIGSAGLAAATEVAAVVEEEQHDDEGSAGASQAMVQSSVLAWQIRRLLWRCRCEEPHTALLLEVPAAMALLLTELMAAWTVSRSTSRIS